jgi:sensor histidine kinase YesM
LRNGTDEWLATEAWLFGKRLLWSSACWLSLAPVMALQWWSNALSMHSPVTLPTYTLIALSSYLAYAMLTPVLFAIVHRWPIEPGSVWLRVTLYVLGSVAFILIAQGVRSLVLPPWDVEAQAFMPRAISTYYSLVTSRFADCVTAYLMILIAAHAFELHDRTRLQQIEHSELQRNLAENELQLLKTQLHPHFLFNTLQGISALTEADPIRAKQMIVALGDLLRAALKHSTVDVVTLATEMDFVDAYLELERMRLGARLKVDIKIPRGVREYLVPQLILQPLVENAIVHGVANSRMGGWIQISSEVNDEQLRLRILNSVSPRPIRGTGLGLRNTRARLEHLYPNDASLTFRLTEDGAAESLIVLPALKGSVACTAS